MYLDFLRDRQEGKNKDLMRFKIEILIYNFMIGNSKYFLK